MHILENYLSYMNVTYPFILKYINVFLFIAFIKYKFERCDNSYEQWGVKVVVPWWAGKLSS